MNLVTLIPGGRGNVRTIDVRLAHTPSDYFTRDADRAIRYLADGHEVTVPDNLMLVDRIAIGYMNFMRNDQP